MARTEAKYLDEKQTEKLLELYSTTNRDGYREYKSNPEICAHCPKRELCTQSKSCRKTVIRHVWANYLDIAEDFRYTPQGKAIYRERAETIERVFADAKEKHGLRYTTLRGKAKVTMQALLTFACMNLKKLAIWKSKDPRFRPSPVSLFRYFLKSTLYLQLNVKSAA